MVDSFCTFWTGPDLSAYEALSLRSLLAHGQRVALYAYDRPGNVPDGVTIRDANDILPADRIHLFTFANGETTPTIHANLFRYALLERIGGWYCDLDVVLLTERLPEAATYFAWEDDTAINNAILRFGAGDPVMKAAFAAAQGLMVSETWGTSGPALLTRLIREQGLVECAAPYGDAYPLRTWEVAMLFMPEHRDLLEERMKDATFVHLWNQIWRRVRIPKELGPPEGSYLDLLFRRFDVKVPPSARLSARAIDAWFRDFHMLADLPRQQAEHAALQGAHAALEAEHGALKAEHTALQAEHAALDTRHAALGTGHAALQSAQAALQARLGEAEWERDELLRSSSWRITRPLRALARAVRGES